MVLMTGVAVVLVLYVAGAGWTAYWSLRFGLTPRPPLSMFETRVRFAAVITALFLAWARQDSMERSALICAVIAAGSSRLYGLGISFGDASSSGFAASLSGLQPWGVGYHAMVSEKARNDPRKQTNKAESFVSIQLFPGSHASLEIPTNSPSKQ